PAFAARFAGAVLLDPELRRATTIPRLGAAGRAKGSSNAAKCPARVLAGYGFRCSLSRAGGALPKAGGRGHVAPGAIRGTGRPIRATRRKARGKEPETAPANLIEALSQRGITCPRHRARSANG